MICYVIGKATSRMHALVMKDVINVSRTIDRQMLQISLPLPVNRPAILPAEFVLSPFPSLAPSPAPTHTSSKSPSQTTLGIP